MVTERIRGEGSQWPTPPLRGINSSRKEIYFLYDAAADDDDANNAAADDDDECRNESYFYCTKFILFISGF